VARAQGRKMVELEPTFVVRVQPGRFWARRVISSTQPRQYFCRAMTTAVPFAKSEAGISQRQRLQGTEFPELPHPNKRLTQIPMPIETNYTISGPFQPVYLE